MNMINNPVFYALFMLVTGLGIPITAALNGGLSERIDNPLLATTILFLVCLICSVALLFIIDGVPTFNRTQPIPFYFYLGGAFIAFYIFGITWIAPKFGVGNAIAFVLLGQMIAMVAVDHFAFLGAVQHSLTLQRLGGIFLMIVGVFLIVQR